MFLKIAITNAFSIRIYGASVIVYVLNVTILIVRLELFSIVWLNLTLSKRLVQQITGELFCVWCFGIVASLLLVKMVGEQIVDIFV